MNIYRECEMAKISTECKFNVHVHLYGPASLASLPLEHAILLLWSQLLWGECSAFLQRQATNTIQPVCSTRYPVQLGDRGTMG